MVERKIHKIFHIIENCKGYLAIPASTIASDSAFSTDKRVLDEKRSRLAPHTIKYVFARKIWIKRSSEHKDSRTMMIKTIMIHG